MALTKFEIASTALIMVGAQPVSSFEGEGTEETVCRHLYQSTIDNLLSLFPWRFASRTTQLARDGGSPDPMPGTLWRASYTAPPDARAIQALMTDVHGTPIPFDRFENKIFCNASETQAVWCTHTYEPPIAWWPGYFVAVAEITLAMRFSFPLAAKIDLETDFQKEFDTAFRYAKNADSRQQTTRKFRVDGRRSIMEARRA